MKDIKPEMHDIGKLIEEKNPLGKRREHNFENYPFGETDLPPIQNNPIWEGIKEHHNKKDKKEFSHSDETLILSLADALASKASRQEVKDDISDFRVYKLWNPSNTLTPDLSACLGFKTDSTNWISEIVNFINQNPSTEEYFQRYGKYLELRAEDVKRGVNISSLYSHSKLTGMFYRLLFTIVPKFGSEFFNNSEKKVIREKYQSLRKSTKIQVVKLTFHFPQEILRIRDLNVFKALEDIKNTIITDNPDSVIYSGFNEMVLIVPIDFEAEKYDYLLKKWNFWYEMRSSEQTIHELIPDPEKTKNNGDTIYRDEIRYLSIESQFHPPICEVCQNSQAKYKWIDEDSGIIEDLCESCIAIRNIGSHFYKLEKWVKFPNTKLLWLRINLNYSQIVESLNDLYHDYVKSFKVSLSDEDLYVKVPTIYDFLHDYNTFYKSFTKKMEDIFYEQNCESIIDGLIVLKSSKLTQVLNCIEQFGLMMKKYFPVFNNRPSPLKIAIICSNPKYSFMDAWRKLINAEDEVYISLLNKGEIRLKIGEISSFLSIRPGGKALIHKLTAISEQSEDLAKILINDRNDRDSYYYRSVRDAVISFGFQNVLTYVKILED